MLVQIEEILCFKKCSPRLNSMVLVKIMFVEKIELWLIIFIVLCSGCSEVKLKQNDQHQESKESYTESNNLIALSTSCPLVCWHDVQVGKTEKSEVIQKIEQNYEIKNIEIGEEAGSTIAEIKSHSGLVVIVINYETKLIEPDRKKFVVASIYLEFNEESFPIETLIPKLGAPNIVHVGRIIDVENKKCSSMDIAYENLGVEIGLMLQNENGRDGFNTVNASMLVDNISIQSRESLINSPPSFYGTVVDWEGFDLNYCEEAWK